MKVSICQGQLLGYCPNCSYDVNKNHHPNNLDCPRYKAIGFVSIDIMEDNKGGESARRKKSASQTTKK